MLVQQATEIADCAARFRQKNASPINQQALFAAQGQVTTAQTMFNVINNQVFNGLSKQEVTAAVATAIHAVDIL